MKLKTLVYAMGLAALSTNAAAEVRFNGFASIVAGMTLSEDETWLGYDDDISFKPESIFALQASADLMDGLTATAQLVATGEDDFDAEFAWAYVSYEFNDNWTVRGGRMRLPVYSYSDYLDVGYAYPWVRPSVAQYSLPFSNYDGLGVLYNTTAGSFDMLFNVAVGSIDDTFFEDDGFPTPSTIKNIVGLNWQVSRDWFNAYAAYFVGDVSIPLQPLQDLGALTGAVGVPVSTVENLLVDDDQGTFYGLGFDLQFEKWFLTFEASSYEIEDSALEESNDAWYVSAGYRMGEFTPYVMFEEFNIDASTSVSSQFPSAPFPDAPGVPPALVGVPINAVVQGAVEAINYDEFDIVSVGIRYDFHSNAALKVEYNMVNNELNDANDADLIAVAVDLIF